MAEVHGALSRCLSKSGETPIRTIQENIFGEIPKNRGTFLGVPILRAIVFWGVYWGPLVLGEHHLGIQGLLKGSTPAP